MTSNLIKIGVITSTHGVRGQVKLHVFTETPESFLTYSNCSDASGKRLFTFKKHGISNNQLILSIDGITDRNQAELLKGTDIYAPSQKKAEGDAITYGELNGLEARLADGTVYGKVIGVYNFGASDIIDIELPNGKTEMLPLTDEFSGDVFIEEGYLIVLPPEYIEADDKDE